MISGDCWNISSLIIKWDITSNNDGILAVSDFQLASGNIIIHVHITINVSTIVLA